MEAPCLGPSPDNLGESRSTSRAASLRFFPVLFSSVLHALYLQNKKLLKNADSIKDQPTVSLCYYIIGSLAFIWLMLGSHFKRFLASRPFLAKTDNADNGSTRSLSSRSANGIKRVLDRFSNEIAPPAHKFWLGAQLANWTSRHISL